MKGIILIQFFICFSFLGFSQESYYFIDCPQSKKPNDLPSLFNFYPRRDTSYYDTRQIKTITVYPLSFSGLNVKTLIFSMDTIIVYQYDECGNLRSMSMIWQIGSPEYFGCMGPMWHHEDCPMANVSCDKPWTKPLVY